MAEVVARNERIKHRYLTFLRHAQGAGEAKIDAVAAALAAFEKQTGRKDFSIFRREQAISFKQHITERLAGRSRHKLSRSTVMSTLSALKAFFQWLSREPGYRSRVHFADAEYFNMNANEARIARAVREPMTPTIGQIERALSAMPCKTSRDRRNRAVMAFTLVSGCRDAALVSLKMKHFDAARHVVHQDAREVHTKRRKTFDSGLFKVSVLARDIFLDWYRELVEILEYGPDDPIFPATRQAFRLGGDCGSSALDRRHWTTAGPVRQIFRDAFEFVGLPYYHPHSFRRTLARVGQQRAKNGEALKAWSQNLGHDDVLTTFTSYGALPFSRQLELLDDLVDESSVPKDNVADALEILKMALSKNR